MTDRPTTETDAAIHVCYDTSSEWHGDWVSADDARRLERERDEAREAAEKAKSYKRVMKEDNAKLRRDLDKAQRDADTFLENFGKSQELAINAERKLDELNKRLIEASQRGVDLLIERQNSRRLLNEIFNLTQIGEPHPDALPMNALRTIADMINEHLKEARK